MVDVEVNGLRMVVGVERSLQDPSREYDAVLSGHVVGINCRRSHAPSAGGEEGRRRREGGQTGVIVVSVEFHSFWVKSTCIFMF